MSITVNKSQAITFDANTTAALESVMNTLNKQSEHVKTVTVLANFSVDQEAALIHDLPWVVQGLVVQTTKNYKLSSEDKSWFHPCVARGRSVYSIANPLSKSSIKQIEMNSNGNSVGEYSVSTSDEFGCEQIEHRLVVDMSSEQAFTATYNEWLRTGITAGELDTQWKRMKFENNFSITSSAQKARDTIAEQVSSSATRIHSDMVNTLLSDLTYVYFTNAAVKAEKSILVKTSNLGGYRMYSTHDDKHKFYPSNLGIAQTFYAWSELSTQSCAKISETCMWGGELSFNSQVMRPLTVQPKDMEAQYNVQLRNTLQMRHCVFSSSDSYRDKIAPADILRITPTTAQSEHAQNYISAPLSMTHPVLQKIMGNIEEIQKKFPDFALFNPKVVTGGRLSIPREVYEHVSK